MLPLSFRSSLLAFQLVGDTLTAPDISPFESWFNDYLHHPQKNVRRKARARILDSSAVQLVQFLSTFLNRISGRDLEKTIKLLSRSNHPKICGFLKTLILKYSPPATRQEDLIRQAAIEALAYHTTTDAHVFLKNLLKKSQTLAIDEATYYLIVESLAHSEHPESISGFDSAQFVPKHFHVGAPSSEFSEKLNEQIQSIRQQMIRNHIKVSNQSNSWKNTKTFRCMTLNLGMLDGTFASVPRYSERSAKLASELKRFLSSSSSADVIFLQELWYENDFDAVTATAKSCGFQTAVSSYAKIKNCGLQILVRSSLCARMQPAQFDVFRDQKKVHARALFERAGAIERGVLHTTVQLTTGEHIALATSHLTPLPRFYGVRNRQILSLAQKLKRLGRRADHVILGADLNIASDYRGKDESPVIYWELDRFNYDVFCLKTKLIDAQVVSGSSPSQYTINRALAARRYSNKDIKQRLDYILFRSHTRRQKLIARKTKLEFDQPIDEVSNLFLSDHFGVITEFELRIADR